MSEVIYLITNTVNGKRYIGKTKNTIEHRWYQHKANAKYGHNTYLYKAIRKYGEDAFTVEKLCDGYDDEEGMMIEKHQPEYNMTAGGDGGDTSSSPNYKAGMALRDTSGKNNSMYGKRGKDNPNYGQVRGPKPLISKGKMKRLISSENICFLGYQSMFEYYNVRSKFSLAKRGVTWSEISK